MPAVVESAASRFASATSGGLLRLPLGPHGQHRGDQGDGEHGGQPDRQPPGPVPGGRLAVRPLAGRRSSSASAAAREASRNALLERRDLGVRAVRPVERGGSRAPR